MEVLEKFQFLFFFEDILRFLNNMNIFREFIFEAFLVLIHINMHEHQKNDVYFHYISASHALF
jgi:hypothetical protein